jgi:DNA-binding transcriptional regulator YdaS (Cro superfamily)
MRLNVQKYKEEKMDIKESNLDAIKKAIEFAGGATALAKKLHVTYHTVLTWKNGRSSISPMNCLNIERVTEGKVKRKDILPNYPWEDFK